MSSRDKHTWWYLLWCNIKHRYKLISYSATSFMCLGTGIWAGKWVYIKHQENGSLFRTWNAPFVFDLHGVFHSIIVFAKRYYQVLEICHVDTFFCKKHYQSCHSANLNLSTLGKVLIGFCIVIFQIWSSHTNNIIIWQLATLEFHEWIPIPIP